MSNVQLVPWEEVFKDRLAALQRKVESAKPLPEPQKQRKMFAGLDCLAGQENLFETDGQPKP